MPVYRRLFKAAKAEYQSELDVSTLRLLVMDVVDGMDDLQVWAIPLDQFERRWNAKTRAAKDRGTSVPRDGKPLRGRPKIIVHDLPQARLYYVLINRYPAGTNQAEFIKSMESDSDVVQIAKAAGELLSVSLLKAAQRWSKRQKIAIRLLSTRIPRPGSFRSFTDFHVMI